MAVLSCVCGYRMEGADDVALFEAVRHHSDSAHAEMALTDDWIRALLAKRARLTPWDGARIPLTAPPAVRPLRPERADDFLAFFDHDAFMDNPDWASCYCLYFNIADSKEWDRRTGEQNREEKATLIRRGEAHGVLAYAGERVVGWCHAAPRATLPALAADLPPDDNEAVGAIVCFAIAPPYRGQGVAARLLEAACDELRALGMTVAEAYPSKETSLSEARAFPGPLSLYLSAGFTPHRQMERAVVVRKQLDAPR